MGQPGQAFSPRSPGDIAIDDPTQSLIQDHTYIKQLFQRYFSTQNIPVQQDTGEQICAALHLHTALEEAVFYPTVESLDPKLVAQCEQDHETADELVAQLQALEPEDSAYEAIMHQLHKDVIAHMAVEEDTLFPLVRKAAIDLHDLALRMQAYESGIGARQSSGSPYQRGEPLR